MKDWLLSPTGILCAWLLLINVMAFAQMGRDKRRAQKKGARRIPEKQFFLLALLGGTPGAIVGMYLFRHKTLRWYFRVGLPLILLLQLLLPAAIRWLPNN